MTALINLLPWRKRTRQRQLRRWGLLAAGCVLSALLVAAVSRALVAWQAEQQRIQAEYLSQLRASLQQKYQAAQKLAKRQKLQEARKAQRLSISEWEPRLIRLAGSLPAGIWLTSLAMAKGRIVLHGNAEKPEDLRLLEQNLRQLPEVINVSAKGIQRNPDSPLAFSFTFAFAEVDSAD
jgi:pilus assembly protein HofN